MSKSIHIPYRSLWKMALLTAPLLAVALASPILIASGIGWEYAGVILPATTGIALLAWALNLAFLPWMQRLGKWKWLQIFLIGGLMISVSMVILKVLHGQLPPQAERLAMIRYVNAFAVNTIIYVLIDLRMLSETKARLVEENAQLRMTGLETQYQILKDQVNPHFLFNALGTIKSLARRDPALTEAYIIRLSDFLRVTLQEARDHVTLSDELRLVRDYIELQKMRFHSAL
ncbi:MAG: histidine kinase, partial [Bacteroidia bacterium]|nr:histidine kinase [Bacteroidia bacterium]